MFWNNEHKIILPDIADFPDCKKIPKIEEDEKIKEILNAIDIALDNNNFPKFQKLITSLSSYSNKIYPLSKKELDIKRYQFSKIKDMGKQHINDSLRKKKIKRDDIRATHIYEELFENGVCKVQIDSSEIKNLLQNKIDILLEQKPLSLDRGYDRSVFLDKKKDKKVFELLNNLYSKAGILSAASKYHSSKDLKVKSICLHIASPEDTHYLQTLKDCKTSTKLVGLHFDPKYVVKSLLYLNNVDEESGPFTFIPGSHRWLFPSGRKVFAKGMSIGNYLNSYEHRKVAMQLPKALRTNSIVGRLIPDGTPLSDRLLKEEVLYTGHKGSAILFDPSTGFHRGGLCKAKQRINLQIVFG